MKPGREIDVLVAKKVMGWADIILDPASQDFVGEPDPKWKSVKHVPMYSTDIAAAEEVRQHISTKDLLFSLRQQRKNNKWRAMFFGRDENSPVYKATADTIPHAICLAALAAMGESEITSAKKV